MWNTYNVKHQLIFMQTLNKKFSIELNLSHKLQSAFKIILQFSLTLSLKCERKYWSRLYGKDGNDGKGGAGGGNISFSVDTTSVCLCQSTYNKCDKLWRPATDIPRQ